MDGEIEVCPTCIISELEKTSSEKLALLNFPVEAGYS
jgi:hypothetical protein